MSDRKQTPDILADLLGGETAAGEAPVSSAKPQPRTARKSASTETRSVRPQRQQQATFLNCWEHRVASFQQHHGWRLRYVDGVKVNDWASGPLLTEYITALAAEGWQVAGVCSGEALFGLLDKYQVFFKRPAQASAERRV